MKDYASMSDEKIAAMVAGLCTIEGVSINEDGVAVRSVVDDSPGSYSGGDYIEFDFDPCNNPADAWPIIVQSGISLIKCTDGSGCWSAEIITDIDEATDNLFQCQSSFDYQDANPLRAAMVVFLMMKDGE